MPRLLGGQVVQCSDSTSMDRLMDRQAQNVEFASPQAIRSPSGDSCYEVLD